MQLFLQSVNLTIQGSGSLLLKDLLSCFLVKKVKGITLERDPVSKKTLNVFVFKKISTFSSPQFLTTELNISRAGWSNQ